jgi:hypothetical protein
LRRFRIIAPALAVVALALAGAVGAASANGGTRGVSTVATPGTFDASGDGIAAAGGQLTIHVCATDGILLARGKVTIDSGAFTDQVGWLGLHVYFGFNGCADVAGGGFGLMHGGGGGGGGSAAALVVGTGLTLHAEGTGIAFLKGDGTWSNGNGESGAWSPDGSILKIGGKQQSQCPGVSAQHHGGDYDKPKCKTPTPQSTSSAEATSTPEPTATSTAIVND